MEKISPKMTISDIANFLGITPQSIHKRIKEKGLNAYRSGNRIYTDHLFGKEFFKFNFKPTCIAMHNLKGGVGKTSLSFNLGCRLSLFGARVALLDLDQQGNLTQACNVNADERPVLIDILTQQAKMSIPDALVNVCSGVDLLPSRTENATLDMYLTLKNLPLDRVLRPAIQELKKEYDFIIMDTPPSLSATVTAAYLAADIIILPTDPETFSLNGIRISLEELSRIAQNYLLKEPPQPKILLNKFDQRTRISSESFRTLMSDPVYGPSTLPVSIRISQEFPNSVAKNKSIFDDLKSTTAKEDIDALVNYLFSLTVEQGIHEDAKSHRSAETETSTEG